MIKITKPALPNATGVYLFKNKLGEIIYAGKAKVLSNRIASYFQKNNKNLKIKKLLKEHDSIDYIITKNEDSALLLEAQIIQSYKPKFNILLKDGQPFLYINFINETIPKMEISRFKNGSSWGPFLSKAQVRSVFYFLQKTFRLKLCNHKIKEGCLNYHLGICAGSCKDNFDLKDYKLRLDFAKNLLKGNYSKIEQDIKNNIKKYNKKLEFEKSRNLLQFLENLKKILDISKTKSLKITEPTLEYPSKELKNFLKLKKNPITIACFDISHFQGLFMTGACVTFTNGHPDKKNFRRFKINDISKPDDYRALQAIIKRRYKNIKDLPDLIVIDGGIGQLNIAKQLFPEVDCVSIAKKEEILFSSKEPKGIKLDLENSISRLLIALRDYTHHFAISYHRKLRSKALKGGK